MSKKSQQNPHNPTQVKKKAAAEHIVPATFAEWLEGARLRTLPLAIVPVLLGTAAALAAAPGEYHWVRALAALAISLLLQIGVNFSNDYSDGIRGTDDVRVGPPRLTASGKVAPTLVRNVAFACFGLAALIGLWLCATTGQWWLIAVGVACILAAWFYTGGKRPYGYFGLGEVFVFLFFGLVATLGTTYVQILDVPADAWPLAIAAGSFACAVLTVNNIRDIEQDRLAGKRTLSVLIGATASKVLFTVLALVPFIATFMFALVFKGVGFAYFALMLIVPAIIITWTATTARELILALKLTSLGALLWAVLMAAGVFFPIIQTSPQPFSPSDPGLDQVPPVATMTP